MEKEIKIAAKLYQCRDTAKRFLKDDYENHLKPYKHLICEVEKVSHKPILECLIDCLNMESIKDNGFAMIWFNAAAVELIENPEGHAV
jgi:hypothetical protein